MRIVAFTAASLLLALTGAAQVSGKPPSLSGEKPPQSSVSVGKYIVEDVAMCSTCHTPRLPNGQFNESKLLMGGRLAFTVPPSGRWASEAPRIAGLTRWEDEEIVILLTTGKLETGLTMRPPMPQFHMTRQDARAVVAYLRSLAPQHKHSKLHQPVSHK